MVDLKHQRTAACEVEITRCIMQTTCEHIDEHEVKGTHGAFLSCYEICPRTANRVREQRHVNNQVVGYISNMSNHDSSYATRASPTGRAQRGAPRHYGFPTAANSGRSMGRSALC